MARSKRSSKEPKSLSKRGQQRHEREKTGVNRAAKPHSQGKRVAKDLKNKDTGDGNNERNNKGLKRAEGTGAGNCSNIAEQLRSGHALSSTFQPNDRLPQTPRSRPQKQQTVSLNGHTASATSELTSNKESSMVAHNISKGDASSMAGSKRVRKPSAPEHSLQEAEVIMDDAFGDAASSVAGLESVGNSSIRNLGQQESQMVTDILSDGDTISMVSFVTAENSLVIERGLQQSDITGDDQFNEYTPSTASPEPSGNSPVCGHDQQAPEVTIDNFRPPYFSNGCLSQRWFSSSIAPMSGYITSPSHPLPRTSTTAGVSDGIPSDNQTEGLEEIVKGDHIKSKKAKETTQFSTPRKQITENAERRMHPVAVERQLTSRPTKMHLLDGLPVVPRKITVELDADDQRLLELKATKHTSRQMAVIFKEEGRRPLNEKSFYSRYKRITDILAAKNDYLLREKLANWTNEEDALLVQAVEECRKERALRHREIDAALWLKVMHNFNGKLPAPKFSATACEKRFKELEVNPAASALSPDPQALADLPSIAGQDPDQSNMEILLSGLPTRRETTVHQKNSVLLTGSFDTCTPTNAEVIEYLAGFETIRIFIVPARPKEILVVFASVLAAAAVLEKLNPSVMATAQRDIAVQIQPVDADECETFLALPSF